MERNLTPPPPTRSLVDFLYTLFSGRAIPYIVSDQNHLEFKRAQIDEIVHRTNRSYPQISRSDGRFPMHLFSKSWNFFKNRILSVWAILFRVLAILMISAKIGFQAAPRKTSDVLECFFEAPEIRFFQKTLDLRQFEAPKRSKKSGKSSKTSEVFAKCRFRMILIWDYIGNGSSGK